MRKGSTQEGDVLIRRLKEIMGSLSCPVGSSGFEAPAPPASQPEQFVTKSAASQPMGYSRGGAGYGVSRMAVGLTA